MEEIEGDRRDNEKKKYNQAIGAVENVTECLFVLSQFFYVSPLSFSISSISSALQLQKTATVKTLKTVLVVVVVLKH